MLKIFPTAKVKELDEYTITHEPIESVDLVERAATLFVREFCQRFSKQNRIIIFAGQGNNGADALAIARLLQEESYHVETFLINPGNYLSSDCVINKQRLLQLEQVSFTEIIDEFALPQLTNRDIVIDGLFGSGLNRPLSGGFASLVQYINNSAETIVSIDIPSGLFGENNLQNNPDAIIRADYTFTFGFPKLAFFFPENARYVGEWKVFDIGLHSTILSQTATPYKMLTEEDMMNVFQPRDRFTHKGDYGHALLIAGSKGKMGAALLAGRACLRTGAGLLTVHIPQRGETILQTAFPEAMVSLDKHTDYFTSLPDLSPYQAIGVGPGLGQNFESAVALDELFQAVRKPMVIDADALNLIAANKELLNAIPPHSILTPHPKEFDRIAGESQTMYERLHKAQALAKEHTLCIVLKGTHTAVCTPGGSIYLNNCGNPGMATAGSGDVLTGILLGLLAQGAAPETAAVAGVFLHGTAGDLAAAYRSEESMLAGDITEMLGKVFKQLK